MTTGPKEPSLGKWRLSDGTMIEEIDPKKLAGFDKTYQFAWNSHHVFDVVHDRNGRACFERDTLNGIALVPVEACRSFLMCNADGRPISTIIVDKSSNRVEWRRVWPGSHKEGADDLTSQDIDKVQSFIIDQGFIPSNENPYHSAGLIKVGDQYHDVRSLPSGLTLEGDLDLWEMRKLPGFDAVPNDLHVTGHYSPPPEKARPGFREKISSIIAGGPKNPGGRTIESGEWMEI